MLKNKLTHSVIYHSYRLMRIANQKIQRIFHYQHLPKISERESEIVNALRTEGVYISSINDLISIGIPFSQELFDSLKSIASQIKNKSSEMENDYIVFASEDLIMEHSEILKWGLNEKILAIVENYVGLPAAYSGVIIRKDIANGYQVKTRYWHKDSEDTRIIKIIIYLEDVGENDGPFCYVPHNVLKKYNFKVFDGNRIFNDDIESVVPLEKFVNCTGPAGTVIFTDTCSVFHRGKTGTVRDRYTAFFIYSSCIPIRPETMAPLFSVKDFVKRFNELPPLQREAISDKLGMRRSS